MAAIKDIVDTTADSILVCCQSNAACDEMMVRLVTVLNFGQCYRMYATSMTKDDIPFNVRSSANLHEDRCQIPALRLVYQARVVVCTLQIAAYFTRSKKDPSFDPHHFQYLILDEAACMEQPAALIPITGD